MTNMGKGHSQMSINLNDVGGEEWARRVQGLGEEERARRLQAVEDLLADPEGISDPLESELYVLRAQLRGQDG